MERLIQTDLGELYYPDGDIMTRNIEEQGTWEPHIANFMRDFLQEGDTFIDVGAHVGYFSVLAASLVGELGQVHSFEPNPEIFELLLKNTQHFDLAYNMQSAVAVTDKRGRRDLFTSDSNSGDSRLTEEEFNGGQHYEVPTICIDDLGLEPDLIKIDAQGLDHLVILGSQLTIVKCEPTFIVEYWPTGTRELGFDPEQLFTICEFLNYNVAPLGVNEIISSESSDYCDLLLTPKN